MNFNFSKKAEYSLNSSLIDEAIRLYGIRVKFLLTEKINLDDTIFGDYSHMKSDAEKIWDMFMLPEMPESFDIGQYMFDEFGFTSFENINLFVSTKMFRGVCEMREIVGNLIVLPSSKVFEITSIEWMVPGINNLFTFADEKSVYKLSCKPYDFKLISELDHKDLVSEFTGISTTPESPETETSETESPTEEIESSSNEVESTEETETSAGGTDSTEEIETPIEEVESSEKMISDYDALDGYFEELIRQKEKQDTELEIKESVTTVVPSDEKKTPDTTEKKPIYDTTEVDIWNGY